MKTLELRHLAPYLSCGIKVKFLDDDTELTGEVKELGWRDDERENEHLRVKTKDDSFGLYFFEVTPLLRPLSDLVKEIEVYGKKFIPIIELANIAFPRHEDIRIHNNKAGLFMGDSAMYSFWFNETDSSFYTTIHYDEGRITPNQLQLFEKLFEWKFDVFGLIKAGLAIDLNTIK